MDMKTSEAMTPTLHPPIPMQSRVTFFQTASPLDGKEGVVKGVASVGIAFTYSVLMDEPVWLGSIEDFVDIVSITGSCLKVLP